VLHFQQIYSWATLTSSIGDVPYTRTLCHDTSQWHDQPRFTQASGSG